MHPPSADPAWHALPLPPHLLAHAASHARDMRARLCALLAPALRPADEAHKARRRRAPQGAVR